MFMLESPPSRKRRRAATSPVDLERSLIAKKQRLTPDEKLSQPHKRPACFWDTLSKIRLTRGALKEFDRRRRQETSPLCSTNAHTQTLDYPEGQKLQQLRRFARVGGPDLSHLRGFSELPLPVSDAMSPYSSGQSRKRASASSRHSGSKTTTYSGNFEQKLIDNGIYPPKHEHRDGRPPQNPANIDDIRARLALPRASLSPSRFTDADYLAFERENTMATGETTTFFKVFPFIAGNEINHRAEADLPLNNLAPFDKGLSELKPDLYHGASASAIHPRIRTDLGPYIIPSKADNSRPAAPNFFFEGKSAQGRADVATRQALIDGATGARAIHQLQNYKAKEPVYDNNAYCFSSTYHSGTGTLQIYATHPTQPLTAGGTAEYHMTKIRGLDITDGKKAFIEGATAYRNARDLAKTYRDTFIEQANQRASQMPPSTNKKLSQSTLSTIASDTSGDELARNEVTPIRRTGRSARGQSLITQFDRKPSRPATTSTERRPSGSTFVAGSSETSEDELAMNEAVKRPRPDPPQCENKQDTACSVGPSGRAKDPVPRHAVEVSPERMHHGDACGWLVHHQDELVFVPDFRWSLCEKDGKDVFYYSSLKVFIYVDMVTDGR
ncbi:hypothetical protein ABEF93_005286 [Exophiala dermatitidis]